MHVISQMLRPSLSYICIRPFHVLDTNMCMSSVNIRNCLLICSSTYAGDVQTHSPDCLTGAYQILSTRQRPAAACCCSYLIHLGHKIWPSSHCLGCLLLASASLDTQLPSVNGSRHWICMQTQMAVSKAENCLNILEVRDDPGRL